MNAYFQLGGSRSGAEDLKRVGALFYYEGLVLIGVRFKYVKLIQSVRYAVPTRKDRGDPLPFLRGGGRGQSVGTSLKPCTEAEEAAPQRKRFDAGSA